MNITPTDILSFIGGCIFYAFRGWLGKLLLALLVKIGKVVFRVTATEVELYALHKNETLAAKQSSKPRAH